VIYKVEEKNKQIAIDNILDGKIIIYPTDTLYGFGVDATNSEAIEKLNIIKNRVKPYSIIVSSIEMIKKYSLINQNKIEFISKYLPGPYTFIINKKENTNLSHLVSCGKNTIGFRIPDSKFIIDIVEEINRPIITTSVNISNSSPLNNIEEIEYSFPNFNFFYYENFKVNKNSKGSTILDYTTDKLKILRMGDGEIV